MFDFQAVAFGGLCVLCDAAQRESCSARFVPSIRGAIDVVWLKCRVGVTSATRYLRNVLLCNALYYGLY